LELRTLEAGFRPRIGVVEKVAVGPLEIETEGDGLAHPQVAEFLPPLVERPGLHGWPQFGRELALDDPAVIDGGEIVFRRPDPGGEFLPVEDVAFLERLESGLPLAIELDADAVEMVQP